MFLCCAWKALYWTAADLEGKNIGVQLGTTGDFIVEEIKDASAAQYNKAVDAVNDLRNGRVDAVIIDKNPMEKVLSLGLKKNIMQLLFQKEMKNWQRV